MKEILFFFLNIALVLSREYPVMSKRIKIFVTPSPNTIKLLKYINDNIRTLKQAGYYIQIEKISSSAMDEDMVDILTRNGITRLPAMKNEHKKTFIGIRDIIKELTGTVKTTERHIKASAPSPGDIGDFWGKELFQVGEDGKMAPRTDSDGGEDNTKADLERRYATYNMPGHYKEGQNKKAAPLPSNIAGSTHVTPDHTATRLRDNISFDDNDPDDKLMAAWYENNIDH